MEKTKMGDEKILILGGLGFIGSNLAQKLVKLGADVTIYDACLDPYGWNFANIKEIKDKIEFIKGDIRDFDSIKEHIKNKDYIFNCAAQVGHIISMKDPFLDIEINCKGTMNVLEACRRFNDDVKIIYTATRGQIGEPIYTPVDEEHPDNPTDIYGINKLAAEKYHLVYNQVYGIPVTLLRLNNVYGPRCQMQHGHYGVLNYFVGRAMQGETITIYGKGNQTRDFVYVDDIVDALTLVARNQAANGEIFMVGSGNEVRFIDMVKLVIKTVGKGKYIHVPYPFERGKVDIKRFVASYAKLNNMLGWHPKVFLEEGVKKTVDFYTERLNEYL